MNETERAKLLAESIDEARRFIKKAEEARERLLSIARYIKNGDEHAWAWAPAGTKEYAAAKRSALDLKNQLTKLTTSKNQ